MEINPLAGQYMNQAYVPFSSAASAVPVQPPAGDNTFDAILKAARTKDTSSAADGSPAVSNAAKAPIDKNDKLYELCMELETFLIKNLIKSMRSTVQKSELMNTGFAGEMYEDMLYDEYAKSFSQNANFGFAEMAYRDLTRTDG